MLEHFAFLGLALDHLRRRNDGQPLIDVLPRGIRLFAEQRQIFLGSSVVARKLKQQVRARGVGGRIAYRCVRPVDYIRRAVLGYNDIRGVEVAVTQMRVLGH